ncbi:unnamed protein product [Xylocopa violacea]|uniref:Uncharacterized protein n=1 Tax=Xylocopa violacea TaxID=135666 RepID=A0ABP1N4X2_XYLVO
MRRMECKEVWSCAQVRHRAGNASRATVLREVLARQPIRHSSPRSFSIVDDAEAASQLPRERKRRASPDGEAESVRGRRRGVRNGMLREMAADAAARLERQSLETKNCFDVALTFFPFVSSSRIIVATNAILPRGTRVFEGSQRERAIPAHLPRGSTWIDATSGERAALDGGWKG